MKPFKRPVILIILFLIILIGLTAYISYKSQREYRLTIQHQWQQQLSTTVHLTQQNLHNFFDKFSENLIVVSNDPVIQSKSCNKRIKLYDEHYCPLFNLWTVHMDYVNAIMLLNKDGKILVKFPQFDSLHRKEASFCPRKIDWEKKSDRNTVYISNVFQNHYHKSAIILSCPVFYNDSFSGVVRWMMTTEKISNRFIDSLKIGNNGYLWMINNDGLIVSHPDSVLRYQNINETYLNQENYFINNTDEFLSTKHFFYEITQNEEGYGTYYDPLKKQYCLCAYEHIKFPDHSFIIIASLPYEEITAPIYKNALKNYSISFLIALIIIIASIFFYRVQSQKTKLEIEKKYLSELAISSDKLRVEKQKRLTAMIDGQESERIRISRELHDGLGQYLLAIKVRMEEMCSQISGKLYDELCVIKTMFVETIDETKRISNNLMPLMLDELGIVTALNNLCNELSATTKIKIDFVSFGIPDHINNKITTYIYRILQEALSNAVKYSGATEINVQLLGNNEQINLIVQDNGKGFIIDAENKSRGNGLNNINERATILNGVFEIESKIGEGTILNIKIPLKS
jgi:signal transduction histidine kinase